MSFSDLLDIVVFKKEICEDCEQEKESDEICEGCEEDIYDLDESELEEEIDSMLQEIGSSTIRMSKKRKIKAFAGLASLQTAKKKNDPLFKKYKLLRDKALEVKRKLMLKYKSKGMRAARQIMQ